MEILSALLSFPYAAYIQPHFTLLRLIILKSFTNSTNNKFLTIQKLPGSLSVMQQYEGEAEPSLPSCTDRVRVKAKHHAVNVREGVKV
jgi:hypothetical protein